jgi:hypothetical protein
MSHFEDFELSKLQPRRSLLLNLEDFSAKMFLVLVPARGPSGFKLTVDRFEVLFPSTNLRSSISLYFLR